MHSSSVRRALISAFQIPFKPCVTNNAENAVMHTRVNALAQRASLASHAPFSTTTIRNAKKSAQARPDKRITLIRYFLHHPTTLMPRPLRFSRNRYLRHWTIHRAWNLYRANLKKSRELELQRQYLAMRDANEELRVGAGDGGRLFRKAQMKTGIWSIPERGGGVPIEYSRGMVEWMGTKGIMGAEAKIWDSGWKRQ